MFKTKIGIIIFLGLFIIGMVIIYSNFSLGVTNYNLSFPNLPEAFDGYKIVQLTDLHSKSFGKNNERLIEKIDKESPHILLMTGDMINTEDKDYGVFFSLVDNLVSKYESYFIVGNHEQNLKDDQLDFLYKELRAAGVTVLDNELRTIEKDGQVINIYGMWFNLRYYSDQRNQIMRDDPERYYFSLDKMEKVMGSYDSSKFSILLTHNPLYFDTYSQWGADLTLTGHIHGGMIRLPFLGGIFSPEKTFFPDYDAGLYSHGDRKMIVGRGLGNGNLGFRFLNSPELIVINLHSKVSVQ